MTKRFARRSIVSSVGVQKLTHSLESTTADWLALFAHRGKFSESAVIEAALEDFFAKAPDAELYDELTRRGFGLRRTRAAPNIRLRGANASKPTKRLRR